MGQNQNVSAEGKIEAGSKISGSSEGNETFQDMVIEESK